MTIVAQVAASVAMVYTNLTTNWTSQDVDSGNNSFDVELSPVTTLTATQSSCVVFLFVFFTIITGLLCILGFIGNGISMYVLQKDRAGRVQAVTFLLQALAVADNCVLGMSFICISIVFGLLPILNAVVVRGYMIPYIVTYIAPVAQMAQTASVWMTALLAVNRYIAICRPFDTHRLVSLKKTKLQIIVVFISSFLLNLPRFFQHTIEYQFDKKLNMTMPKHIATSIGPRTLFGMVYNQWLYSIIVLLLPLLLLLILNSKLIIELRKMSKRSASYPQNNQRSEENITLVMVIIIIVFIICNTPNRINEVVKYFTRHPMCSGWFYFDCVCQFCIVANSSTNFLVYYIFRRRFRQVLFQQARALFCSGVQSQINTANNEYNMNRLSQFSDPRQTLTLLSTNGMTHTFIQT